MYLNKINIEKERQGARECLEMQATKIKLMSGKSDSETSLGTTVRIRVPEVDRGRGEARSTLTVVVENIGRGFFRDRTTRWTNKTIVL